MRRSSRIRRVAALHLPPPQPLGKDPVSRLLPSQAELPGIDARKPLFGARFMDDHVGHIMGEPKTALVELVANASDAGALEVRLDCPTDIRQVLAVEDNGSGMTKEEFEVRWLTLSYNRLQYQGRDVTFPPGVSVGSRKAFGRNGKGRHGLFCFDDSYEVETWKDGVANRFQVMRTQAEETPFKIRHLGTAVKTGHGTRLSVKVMRNHLAPTAIKEVVGSRFQADPNFRVIVNGEPVELEDLRHLVIRDLRVPVPPHGEVNLRCLDSGQAGRTTRHSGVAWWVNGRLVGEPSWDSLKGSFLDGRTTEARRYTFIVEAECLVEDVRDDWSRFKRTPRVEQVRAAVDAAVQEILRELLSDALRSRKRAALAENRAQVRALSPIAQDTLGTFLDELQVTLPRLSQQDLINATELFVKMEQSRSGYALLAKLVELPADDIDGLNEILSKWTVRDAQVVLEELERRLLIIRDLERLVDDSRTRELQDLQPLFEKALWIFGPEYECIDFTSNRSLAAVLRSLFQTEGVDPPNLRPDFVIVPSRHASFGAYTRDAFDQAGEACGFAKVVVLELKRGGFQLGLNEIQQAQRYALELKNRCGPLPGDAEIVAFVLGSTMEAGLEAMSMAGSPRIRIEPRQYAVVLRQANLRTFKLREKLQQFARATDVDVRNVLGQTELAIETPLVPGRASTTVEASRASPA